MKRYLQGDCDDICCRISVKREKETQGTVKMIKGMRDERGREERGVGELM